MVVREGDGAFVDARDRRPADDFSVRDLAQVVLAEREARGEDVVIGRGCRASVANGEGLAPPKPAAGGAPLASCETRFACCGHAPGAPAAAGARRALGVISRGKRGAARRRPLSAVYLRPGAYLMAREPRKVGSYRALSLARSVPCTADVVIANVRIACAIASVISSSAVMPSSLSLTFA